MKKIKPDKKMKFEHDPCFYKIDFSRIQNLNDHLCHHPNRQKLICLLDEFRISN